MSTIQVVVGGQAGSEAKGAIAAKLAAENIEEGKQNLAVRVGGPNAGHTAIDSEYRRWALRQIPVAAVIDSNAELYIAAGSEIDIEVLRDEVSTLERAGFSIRDRLFIDREATIIEPKHREQEQELVGRIGSTGKGIGAARADRIMRTAQIAENADFDMSDIQLINVARRLQMKLYDYDAAVATIEATQGYILGLHAGHYPYCTSGDCRAVDVLAQAGLNLFDADCAEIYIVFRTYPIRVAGPSGPMFEEVSWEQLGLPAELTTVTRKVRRVARWDSEWARQAIQANGGRDYQTGVNWPVKMCTCLTQLDYLAPELAHQSINVEQFKQLTNKLPELGEIVNAIGIPAIVGTGPATHSRLVR